MKIIILVGFMLLLLGCSSKTLVNTYESLPDLSKYENQDKKGNKGEMSVSLFSLNNYTDTPRAGMRSANIIEGILLTKGFKVINHFKIDASKLTDVKNISKNDKSMYYLIGGLIGVAAGVTGAWIFGQASGMRTEIVVSSVLLAFGSGIAIQVSPINIILV